MNEEERRRRICQRMTEAYVRCKDHTCPECGNKSWQRLDSNNIMEPKHGLCYHWTECLNCGEVFDFVDDNPEDLINHE